MNYQTIQPSDIDDAVKVLARTDRGKEVMTHILEMLDNGGCSLDLEGQKAVFTLLHATWGKYAGSTRDAMREAIGPQE